MNLARFLIRVILMFLDLDSGLSRPPYLDWNAEVASVLRVIGAALVGKSNGIRIPFGGGLLCRGQIGRSHG